jgi:TetR/AcrR family transcriptional regulator, cholesterol catabolism regulator
LENLEYYFIERRVNEMAELKQTFKKKKLTSRDLQAAERRQQLLDAAKKLFADKGYHATSTKEINRSIGMADGLIYHYFPDGKLEILRTIVQEATEGKMQILDQAMREIDDTMPIRELLIYVGQGLLDHALNDRDLLMIILREQPLLMDEQIEWLPQALHVLTARFTELLEQRVGRGEIRPLNCMIMARQYVYSILSYVVMQELIGHQRLDPINREEFLNQTVDYTLQCWGYCE